MQKKQEFSVLDPKGLNTIAFAIENDYIGKEEILTLKMLDNSVEKEEEKNRKTFFVDTDAEVTVLMLTMGKNKVVLNSGVLKDNEVSVISKPNILKYEPILCTDKDVKFRDFKYTNNLKRPISIIDIETGEEIKPKLYLDKDTGDIIGKCEMMPYRPYVALELKE